MDDNRPVRWGVMSTAGIAAGNFLPSLRASGNGLAYAVASRSAGTGEEFARKHEIERVYQGYERLLDDPQIDAVYIPLPNHLHAEWTIAALRAGKPVLCEKPLCLTVEQTEQVLAVARQTGILLWEAFVFPFHPQTLHLQEWLAQEAVGQVREIRANFHFKTRVREGNIRFSAEMGGGAVNDVGCYALSLAHLIYGVAPDRAVGMATWGPEGIDEDAQAILEYPGGGRLVLSCSLVWPYDASASIVGTEGRVELGNAYHPSVDDRLVLRRSDETVTEICGIAEPTFTSALRHMNAAIRGLEEPRHLAVDDSLGIAIGLALVQGSIRGETCTTESSRH